MSSKNFLTCLPSICWVLAAGCCPVAQFFPFRSFLKKRHPFEPLWALSWANCSIFNQATCWFFHEKLGCNQWDIVISWNLTVDNVLSHVILILSTSGNGWYCPTWPVDRDKGDYKQGICVCPIFSQTYTYVTCRETGKIKCKMTYIPPDVAMSHLQQAENRWYTWLFFDPWLVVLHGKFRIEQWIETPLG